MAPQTPTHGRHTQPAFSPPARREANAAAAHLPPTAAFDTSLRRSAQALARPRSAPACTFAGGGTAAVVPDWRADGWQHAQALSLPDTAALSDAERWALARTQRRERATETRSGVSSSALHAAATHLDPGNSNAGQVFPADVAAAARRSHDFAASESTRARIVRRTLAFGAPPPRSASVDAELLSLRHAALSRLNAQRLRPERLLVQGVRLSAHDLQQAWALALAHDRANSHSSCALWEPLSGREAALLATRFSVPGSHATWACALTNSQDGIAVQQTRLSQQRQQAGALLDELVEAVVVGEAHQLAQQPVRPA